MKPTKPKSFRATAIAMAAAAMLVSTGLHAGIIDNSNNTDGKLGACGVDGEPKACVGAWNLDNVEVSLIRALDGTVFGEFIETTGLYTALAAGDSFVSAVKDTAGAVVAKVTGKVWPVGEPTGIKAVNNDVDVKEGKPQNCLINTAYLGADLTTPSTADDVDTYLDSTTPMPVICSSPFQSHKRFKIAMQPATTAEVADGDAGNPIDLVFNATDNGSLTPYQVFSKINNYTDRRLKGYKIIVGRGLGADFRSATDLGIADKLHLSLGIDEGWSSGSMAAPDGSNLFDGDGLATFSHGLFGKIELPHFPNNGFFDIATAGFEVSATCTQAGAEVACATLPLDPAVSPDTLTASDTIKSGLPLTSNYTTFFGDWLPSKWQPKGIFWDFDNDPTTDPTLMAWWNGSAWIKNYDSGFATVTADELNTWASDPQKLYAIDSIEDVLNLGINYIVKVGDINTAANAPNGNPNTFTIRIQPVVADTQVAPSFVGSEPPALEPTPVVPVDPAPATTSDGGGCSASTSQRPVDPVLPLLAALGLAGWALRRARRN